MRKTKLKKSTTIKEYKATVFKYEVVVPAGSIVTNETACGPDDSYRFWTDFHEQTEKLTGFKDSMLKHDLESRGLNIPAEYCEPYKESK